MRRRHFKTDRALGERLIKEARIARERADQLPPGAEREDLLEKAREPDVAAHISEWVNSPGLRSPK
jgi:hypothetical protein